MKWPTSNTINSTSAVCLSDTTLWPQAPGLGTSTTCQQKEKSKTKALVINNMCSVLRAGLYNTIQYKTCNAPYVSKMLFIGAGINHCAGCTMGGAPHQLPDFYHAVWTFRNYKFCVGLNVTMTTKKGRQLFGGRKVHSQRKCWLRVWEKGPRLTLVWGTQMVNPRTYE